ncbi:hypothetical protein ACFL2Y_04460 [Candidatus Omnitrophota bacterium]
MLRKLIIGAIVANFVFMLLGVITTTDDFLTPSFANETSFTTSASANVPDILQLVSVGLRRIDASLNITDPWAEVGTSAATSLNFGELVYESEFGALRNEFYYVQVMIPVSSGRAFTISQYGDALSGPGTFPNNRFVITPDYAGKDEFKIGDDFEAQEDMPSGAYLASPTTAVGDKVIYTSDSEGTTCIIRGVLSIPMEPAGSDEFPFNYSRGTDKDGNPDGTKQYYGGWEQLKPGDVPPGDYSGSVTFTLNLV